ncbi:ester cyclase [soil metagenome]
MALKSAETSPPDPDTPNGAPTLEHNLTELRRKGGLPEKQALRGFEPQYRDIVDYIVRITHRIWEEGDMGYIYDTYLHNVTVHTGFGTAYGVEEVVSGSIAFLAALPDRRMYAEDVVWTGDDVAGFHTSHLIVNTGTNSGYSPWGPPTGKRVGFLALANCLVRENRIVEEWLVRDTGALLRGMGFDLWEVARAAVRTLPPRVFGETDRLQGQHPPVSYEPHHDEPHVEGPHIEDFVRRLFHEVWNGRHFNVLSEVYAGDSSLLVPGGLTLRGVANSRAYHLNFIAMFPDAHLNVEHVYWLGTDADGYRVAVRWRFAGTHTRYGWYGPPTDKRVDILGISHLHVKDGKVTKHYLVFDELAVVMQLVA